MLQLENIIARKKEDLEFKEKLEKIGLSGKEERDYFFRVMVGMSEQRNEETHPYGEGELKMTIKEITKKCVDIANYHLKRNSSIEKTIAQSTTNTSGYADDLTFHLYSPTSSRAIRHYLKSFLLIMKETALK